MTIFTFHYTFPAIAFFILYKFNNRSNLPICYLWIIRKLLIEHTIPYFREFKITYFYKHTITTKF